MSRPYQLLEEVRQFSTQTLRSVASQYDKSETYPSSEMKMLFDKRILELILGMQVQDECFSHFLEVIRIVSQDFASVGSILLTQATAGVIPIDQFATDEQRQGYLQGVVTGQTVAALALSEKNTGAHLKKIRTTARETEDGWVIQGEKVTISNAPIADIILVVAKIEGLHSQDSEDCIGIFIVDGKAEGLNVQSPDFKTGITSLPIATVEMDHVKLKSDALLGNNRQAAFFVQYLMKLQKIMIATQAIGIAEGAMSRGLAHVMSDRRFGQRLIDLKKIQFSLAEVQTKIEVANAFLKEVAFREKLDSNSVAMLKLMASDLAIEATETTLQVTGGYAYMRNNELERFVRDAKITAIYGGSSITQKMIISSPWVNNKNNGGK